jgi:HSP20 family protein
MSKNKYVVGRTDYWPRTGVSGFDTMLDNLVAQAFPDLRNDWAVSFEGSAFPRVNIIERDAEFTIEADVHGYAKEDVRVEYDKKKNVITIAGSSAVSDEKIEGTYLKREIKRGSFSRSFAIGKEMNGDNIAVDYKDGTVTIRIPKVRREDSVLRLL